MIRIILDSASDYTPEEFQQKNLEMVPFTVTFGEETYRDGIDITRDEYFKKLVESDVFPTTAQPSPAGFLDHFEAAKEAGDEVLCMTLALALSGSFQSATLAKDMAEYDKITVIDPFTATAGIQLLANHACDMRDAGKSVSEIVEEIESLRHRVRLYFIVDTLEYLFKGGRLSRASFMAGRMMNIKPLLMLGEKGEIIVTDRSRGTKRAMDALIGHIAEMPPDPDYPFYSIYSGDVGNCEMVEERLKSEGYPIDDRRQFGLTIGTHSGPGCAGCVYIEKEKEPEKAAETKAAADADTKKE